jgi:hypothetical protein
MEGIESWRTSSYSGNGGECAEVATAPGRVLVRDSRDRDGAVLAVPASAWRAFTASLKGGFTAAANR